MLECGVKESHLFMNMQLGKDFNRLAYLKLLNTLRLGDVLVVKSIDRLGRDYEEIIKQWRIITKERQVAIVVLDIPLLDTSQKERNLTGTIIADLVLQILSYVAQTEREFNRQQQLEGIAAAKAKGIPYGRPLKERSKWNHCGWSVWISGFQFMWRLFSAECVIIYSLHKPIIWFVQMIACKFYAFGKQRKAGLLIIYFLHKF